MFKEINKDCFEDTDPISFILIANVLGCELEKLKMCGDCEGTEKFWEDFDADLILEKAHAFSVTKGKDWIEYISLIPLRSGRFVIEQRLIDSGGSVSNYWRA